MFVKIKYYGLFNDYIFGNGDSHIWWGYFGWVYRWKEKKIIYDTILINSNINTSYGIVCNLDGIYCGGKVTGISC